MRAPSLASDSGGAARRTRASHPVFMASDTFAPAVISRSASVERPKIDADLSVYRHLRSTEGTIQAEKSRPNIQEIAGFQNRDPVIKTSEPDLEYQSQGHAEIRAIQFRK